MAKSMVGEAVTAVVVLTADLRKRLTAERKGLATLADNYEVVKKRVAERAPVLMRLFNDIKQAQPNPDAFGLADFAREFDPTVPTHAADKGDAVGYRNHKMYYTLTYMQRVQRQKDKPKGVQGQFSGATAKLERTIKTLLLIAKDAGDLWRFFASEFGMEERTLKILQNRVAKVEPFVDLSGLIKPINFAAAKPVHMARAPQGTAAAESIEAMRGGLANLDAARGAKRKAA